MIASVPMHLRFSGGTAARRLTAGALIGLIVAAGWPVTPATAHAALKSAVPKAGAVLPQPPESVILTFNEKLQDDFTTVRIASAGSPLRLAAAKTSGAVVSQPMPADLQAGAYTASYRVVSADGHPISGELSFRVNEASPDPTPTLSSRRPSADAAALAAPATATAERGNRVAWLWLVPVLGLFTALTFAILVAGRRRGLRADRDRSR